MLFESRSFWHPKDTQFANEYEDAYQVREDGVAAIADGVSSAIFSRQWADLLTRGVVASPPDLADSAAFQQWLADLRRAWSDAIDVSKLNWMQRQKLQQAGGAYATLLWAEFYPEPVGPADEPTKYRYRCFAIGDCCLFHVRGEELLRKFPLESVEEFAADPITICSLDRNLDHLLEFHALDDFCEAEDLVVLASDAFAKWIYQQVEANSPVDWNALWNMSPERWTEQVATLRGLPSEQRMRVDDTTLLMLRMVDATEVAQPEPTVVENSMAPDAPIADDHASIIVTGQISAAIQETEVAKSEPDMVAPVASTNEVTLNETISEKFGAPNGFAGREPDSRAVAVETNPTPDA